LASQTCHNKSAEKKKKKGETFHPPCRTQARNIGQIKKTKKARKWTVSKKARQNRREKEGKRRRRRGGGGKKKKGSFQSSSPPLLHCFLGVEGGGGGGGKEGERGGGRRFSCLCWHWCVIYMEGWLEGGREERGGGGEKRKKLTVVWPPFVNAPKRKKGGEGERGEEEPVIRLVRLYSIAACPVAREKRKRKGKEKRERWYRTKYCNWNVLESRNSDGRPEEERERRKGRGKGGKEKKKKGGTFILL